MSEKTKSKLSGWMNPNAEESVASTSLAPTSDETVAAWDVPAMSSSLTSTVGKLELQKDAIILCQTRSQSALWLSLGKLSF